MTTLDHLLAAHCAPALAGIKPASLVSCQRSQFPQLSRQLEEYRRAFAPVSYTHLTLPTN